MRLVSALFILPVAVAAQTATRESAAITVGPNVQVSAARPNEAHDEVLIAADPNDASHLLACSMLLPASQVYDLTTVVVYASSDAGRSWSPVLSDSPDVGVAGEGRFDPACTFGPGGTAYAALLPMTVYGSTDAGHSWTRSAIPAPRSQDRVYVVADNTGGRYHGRVYVYAQMAGQLLDGKSLPSGITLWRSLDGGKTFGNPVQSFPDSQLTRRTAFHPGNSVVMSDGTWAAVFNQLILERRDDGLVGSRRGPPSQVNAHIEVITSSDGGESMNGAVTVSDAYSDWRRGNTIPTMAVDAGSAAFKDRLYVVWVDGRFHADQPLLADGRIGGRGQVMLSYSDDHGKSWSKPRLVNDDLRFHETGDLERGVGLASVAVNPDGVVGVVWEDRRDNAADELGYDIRFAASFDGGETFTPSVKVSEKPRVIGQNERWIAQVASAGATTLEVYRKEWGTGGHTMGLAADANGVFHPLWVDNRTGIHQVWTASVQVRGEVAKFGTPELAELHDLGKKVAIEALGMSFDRATRRLETTVRLRNSSKEMISGPLKLRALTILSEASTTGTAQVVGADNGDAGPGAVWDFTALLANGSLAPDSVSRARTLVFQLPALRTMGRGREFHFGNPWPGTLLHFEGQILGKASGGVRAAGGER
jgi:hypothetical protein